MLTISIQNAKSPSYVTIRTTPFRWGVANRLTVVTVFLCLVYQETTILAMPVWADGLAPCRPRKIDNTRERDYNKDKGNTVSRRLVLRFSYEK